MPQVVSPQPRDSSQPIRPRVVTNSPAKAYFDEGTSCLREGRYEEAERLARDHAKELDAFLTQSKTVPKVGAFEGAGYASKGLYRPALDCIMFSRGTKPFCPVCERAIRRVIDRHGE